MEFKQKPGNRHGSLEKSDLKAEVRDKRNRRVSWELLLKDGLGLLEGDRGLADPASPTVPLSFLKAEVWGHRR